MQLTYFVKQLAGAMATPLAFALVVGVAGAILRILGRRRISTAFWISAAAIVYLSATAPLANALLRPLEYRYAPLRDIRHLPPVAYVVVLGSDYAPHDGIPVTAALQEAGLARIAEGVRLVRQIQGARLVVSGGAHGKHAASAMGYAQFAADFGIDAASIVKLDQALDTADEAASVSALVGPAPFILVTSAFHMPRAMRLMQLTGAHPIPAPTGQLTARQVDFEPLGWIPTSGSLRKTDRALHEYIGLAISH